MTKPVRFLLLLLLGTLISGCSSPPAVRELNATLKGRLQGVWKSYRIESPDPERNRNRWELQLTTDNRFTRTIRHPDGSTDITTGRFVWMEDEGQIQFIPVPDSATKAEEDELKGPASERYFVFPFGRGERLLLSRPDLNIILVRPKEAKN